MKSKSIDKHIREKEEKIMLKKFKNDKRGIFGLTAVQQFFVVILGIALLAYVIVVIMGTLLANTNQLLPLTTTSVVNESVTDFSDAAYTVLFGRGGYPGFSNAVFVSMCNETNVFTNGVSANWTFTSAGVLTGSGTLNSTVMKLSYTYQQYGIPANQLNNVLSNTSSGISGFFSNINPVYAILAVLVIILVLVVLVRVVSGGQGVSGSREATTPL